MTASAATIDESADEAMHVISVAPFRLHQGDILAFVVSVSPLPRACEAELRESLRKHVPAGVEVAVVYGGHLAVLKELPQA